MRTLLILFFCLFSMLYGEVYYSFGNVQLNYLDWSESTQKRVKLERDYFYITLEGGIGGSFGELYGNANLENAHKDYKEDAPFNRRYSTFVDYDFPFYNEIRLHMQNFHLDTYSYKVNDFVIGIAYKYKAASGFWIRPFLGFHKTDDTYFNGWNGYMAGWVFDLPFELKGEKFSLGQWNEIEFGRNKSFYLLDDGTPVGDGESYGLNGALCMWWYAHVHITAGLQYRYALYKLGNRAYQSAVIYTMKYNF